MTSLATFPGRHQRVMADTSDPIHRACDFYTLSGERDIVALNKWLHSQEVWSPWPDYLIAFASNGCGDYFAYDTRQSPAPIVYIGPDGTPEEKLADPDALRYESFDEWYESEMERYTCSRCGDRDVRFEVSQDKRWLLRVCSACGFQEQTDVIDL
jgi:hypothetical protein